MEYCKFTISVNKHRTFDEVPIRKPDDGYYLSTTDSSSRREKKQALSTSTILEVHLDGYKVVNPAFIYELRTILEEFCAKRLGERKPGRSLNAVIEPFGIEYGAISIERAESRLVIKLVDHDTATTLVALDVVHAKTLHGILQKALQHSDFQ